MSTILYIFIATWPAIIGIWSSLFPTGLSHIEPLRIIVLFVAVIATMRRVFVRKPINFDSVWISALVLILYSTCNFLLNPTFFGTWNSIVYFLDTYFLGTLIYYTLMNSQDVIKRKALAKAILTCGVIIAISGIAEALAGKNLIGLPNILSASIGMRLFRANGPFYDVITFSAIVLLFVPFTYFCVREKLIIPRWGWMLIVLFIIGSSANASRATILTMILICLFYLLRPNAKGFLAVFYISILSFIVLYVFYDATFSQDIVAKRLMDKTTIVSRFKQYQNILKEFLDSPITGMGYGMFGKKYGLQIHNSFVKVLTEFGIIGFLSFFYFIYSVTLRKLRQTIRKKNTNLVKARISIVFIVFLIGNTIDLLGNRDFIIPLCIIMFFFIHYESIPSDSQRNVDVSNTTASLKHHGYSVK